MRIKTHILILFFLIISSTFSFSQVHRLGFDFEFNLYTNTTKTSDINLTPGLKVVYGIDFGEYLDFESRFGATSENLKYFGGWQFGIYYKPEIYKNEIYGIFGINLLRNSSEGSPNYEPVNEIDKYHFLLNIGFGSNRTNVFFYELLYQQNLGDEIVSYDATGVKGGDFTTIPKLYNYSIKIVFGFAWDL